MDLFSFGSRFGSCCPSNNISTELGVNKDGTVSAIELDACTLEQGTDCGHVERLTWPFYLDDKMRGRTSLLHFNVFHSSARCNADNRFFRLAGYRRFSCIAIPLSSGLKHRVQFLTPVSYLHNDMR